MTFIYTFSKIEIEIDDIKKIINDSIYDISIFFITKDDLDLKIIVNRSLKEDEEILLYKKLCIDSK